MPRGEVWWAELPEPAGRRPVVLLTRDSGIGARQLVSVAIVTRTVRHIPTEVSLGAADGMPKPCVVNADTIQTIPKTTLVNRVTVLSKLRMQELARAVEFALALGE